LRVLQLLTVSATAKQASDVQSTESAWNGFERHDKLGTQGNGRRRRIRRTTIEAKRTANIERDGCEAFPLPRGTLHP
jgi:hypothetical protein